LLTKIIAAMNIIINYNLMPELLSFGENNSIDGLI